MTQGIKKKILITGATGYIGRRLLYKLLKRNDLDIRVLVRNRNKLAVAVRDQVETIEGSTFDTKSLDLALQGVDTTFYLIHSMGSADDYRDLDRKSAINFLNSCKKNNVKRIVYLGGLGDKETASKHLLSRIETGELLSVDNSSLQTIWIRAGVIIGSGSASFEIIRNLAQKLPIMVTPQWVRTKTQPIGIEDVLSYLDSSIDLKMRDNLIVDIGAEPISFQQMLGSAAKKMGLKRYLIPVPVLSPRLSSYWLILFTPVPMKLASALVEGLKSETLQRNDNATKYYPHITPTPYEEAVQLASRELIENQVISRWCDSSTEQACDISDCDDPAGAILRDVRKVPLKGVDRVSVFKAACSIGGEKGWYKYNILWLARGVIDKLSGGFGLSRGRRSQTTLRLGDALDFWQVADIKENKRLLLYAQMKIPGRAWLEFDIHEDYLIQTAHFIPRGLWGRLYWYSILPLHNLVFEDLAKKIVQEGRKISLELDLSMIKQF